MTPRRSVLYLPASNARALDKARTLPADVVILDLEDAVGPDDKVAARDAAVQALAQGGFRAHEVGVRVNALDTPWGEDDLAAVAAAGAPVVVAPKVSSGPEAARYVTRLGPNATLWAMIETPLALMNLAAVAATPGLSALMLGVNDLAAMMRSGAAFDREPLKTALFLTVAAARANGLSAIDGVFNALQDDDGLLAECEQGRLYGFDGKSVIHPRQIEAANRVFAPSPEQVDEARAVVEAFQSAENAGRGVIRMGDRMVERLHLERARDVLALHDRIGSP